MKHDDWMFRKCPFCGNMDNSYFDFEERTREMTDLKFVSKEL